MKEEEPEAPVSTEPELSTSEKDRQELEENLSMDLLEMEVGYELVPLVDMSNDGMLLKRISGIRKQIANDLGVIVQPIHMRDNLMLKPAEYRVMLSGQEIARGEIRPRRLLAMNPAGGAPNIEGEVTVEPAFGLDARWIFEDQKEKAEMMGYTVVDAPTVAATHLGEVLTAHAASLLGRRELQELLRFMGERTPRSLRSLSQTFSTTGSSSRSCAIYWQRDSPFVTSVQSWRHWLILRVTTKMLTSSASWFASG